MTANVVAKEETKEEPGKDELQGEAADETGVAPLSKMPTSLKGRIEMAFHQARGGCILMHLD